MIGHAVEALGIGDELFWQPIRLAPPGPWVGHIPFAFWLARQLQPSIFVELGTHAANSYFAFCQGMAAGGSPGRAYAVDTWQGDEHAGYYGEEVFADVNAFNEAHYKPFSTLLRSLFDDARGYFEDGTVDLLHIDGLHSYEAVRHDFETWRSALSPRAVVVFHDTNVRERGFGVWRLWAELAAQHPSFEFHHSHGLGVLGVGSEQTSALKTLFAAGAEPKAAGAVRSLFAGRGEVFQYGIEAAEFKRAVLHGQQERARSLASQAEAQARELDQAVLHGQQELARSLASQAEAQARELDQVARHLAEEAAARRSAESELQGKQDALAYQQELTRSVGDIVSTKDQVIRLQADDLLARDAAMQARDLALDHRDAVIRDREQRLREQDAELHLLAGAVEDAGRAARSRIQADYETVLAELANRTRTAEATIALQGELAVRVEQAYVNSTSWRLTAPVRLATSLVRGRKASSTSLATALQELVPYHAPSPSSSPDVAEPSLPEAQSEKVAAAPVLDPRSIARGLTAARLGAFLSSGAALRLPQAASIPDVSILLVLFNQADLTYACLEAIAATLAGSRLTAEVLILDNASTDQTSQLLKRISGAAKIIRSDWNRHYLLGVNAIAGYATGRHILLLNNDAQLLPGALDAAVEVLDGDAAVGAVGGRIILIDGTLQEAGSIIWNDGTCVGYGRGSAPDDPDYMFRRDVDYCSGAFLMTPRPVFERLGGFDPRFAPAYYEETDYCVRLWESGMRIVFEPAASILHFEFGSAANTGEVLALQRRNLDVFRSQHEAWLRGQAPPAPGNVLRASRRLKAGARRVLMIEDRVPHPELGSGYPRSQHLLQQLVTAGAGVTFFPMFLHTEEWSSVRRVVGPNVQIMIRACAQDLRRFLESRAGQFEGVLVCRPHNMRAFLEAVGPDRDRLLVQARLVYDAEAVFARRSVLEAETEGKPIDPETARRLVAEEVMLTRSADEVLSVSASELDVFKQHGVESVHLLGHSIELAPTDTSFADRQGFVFFGAIPDDRAPNADAVRWFAGEVLPLLREILGQPDLRLRVIGRIGSDSIRALDGNSVELLGQILDLAVELADARVMVVPTRFAAGIPHKAHQAAALGIPMVVTDLIKEQLGWQSGKELLTATEPGRFADACAQLYTDQETWLRIRQAALDRVAVECAPERFASTVRGIVSRMPGCTAGVPHPARDGLLPPNVPIYVGRPEEEDGSVAVPFSYPPSPVVISPHVALICHLFHPELAAETLSYLNNMPFPADIKLSTDTAEKAAVLKDAFSQWDKGEVDIRIVPNRGRDIAPKLVGFQDAYSNYDYVLHLHSKQSKHADFLAPWRAYLYRTLLGSPSIIRSVFEAFKQVPQLGIIAPQHFEPVRRWLDWGGNLEQAQLLAARMNIVLQPDAALDFPSGSMFWARSLALQPLVGLQLRFNDFPVEAGQVDGTPAHAIERLYFHICEVAGFKWLKIADPALLFDNRTIVRLENPSDLHAFMVRHGANLSSYRLRRRAEAPPLMVRSPAILADLPS